MSSEAVIKSVSQKLKHYFEVKRLEDGFDLTGPYSPTMDHPPMKARSTLQYDGLHDKPVKKYFSPLKVRVNLTQMKCPEGKAERQDQIRSLVTRYMDDSNFVKRYLSQQKTEEDPYLKHPTMPEYSYYHTPRGRKLRVEYQGHGTGSLRKKRKPYNGGYPLLRSVAPHTISKGEAVRLVNVATKLLLATETYDMKSGKSSRSSSANGGLPHLRVKRPSTAKAAYTRPSHDIDGRKMVQRKSKDDSDLLDDSGFSQSPGAGSGSQPMAAWLRKEIQKLDRQDGQPVENKFVHPAPQRRPRSALRRKPLADPLENQGTQTREDASVQTEGKLLDEYDQMERIVMSGPQAKYRVYVRTGSKLGASTTADVFITLYGTKGRSEEILLGESKNHKCKFVKGQEDEFHFTYFHVGEIKKIRIGHNRTELGSGWYLDTCTVNDLHERVSYRCRCERWLSYRDEDGKTKRYFPVDTTRNIPPDSELTESETNYSVSSRRSSTSSYTSIEAGHSNKQLGATAYFNSETSSDTETESDIARVDIRSESTLRTKEPSSSAKSSTIQSSSKPITDFSSNKAQVSSRSDEKAGNDDSSSDVPVVMPIEEPTLSVKEKSGKKDKKKDSDDYMEGFKAGVNAARRSEDEKARHLEEEQSKISHGACIHEASKIGDLRRVIVLVNHKPELIDAKDERGSSALHLAAAFGHIELVKWLAINCADLNAETPTGYTPVHVAALNGHTQCVMTLSAMGATVDPESIDKQTPLHLASMSGRLETCKWLVSNDADLDAEDNMERTPLELAEEYGHQDLANFLRTVKKEKQDPKSGYSLMRSSEKAPMSTISEEKKAGGSSAGTSSSKKAELERIRDEENSVVSSRSDDSEKTPRIDPGSEASDTERTERQKQKQQEELQANYKMLKEKRKQYTEQKKKMDVNHTSFLDSIRDEALHGDEWI
ncbi:uncharacterized protein LOC135484949 isoform X3 [Lineus longissimus]|uniref:uncharacterized protein LOC135484949 isoform X3 n=1 Tax=Lineus longissimus TaxID=88925 RepID=UPI00315CA0FF